MSGFLRGLLLGVLLIGAGWFVGSIYPAPDVLTAPVKQRADRVAERLDFGPEALAKLRATLTVQEFDALKFDAAQFAASTGGAVLVEHDASALSEHVDAIEAMEKQAPAPATAAATFDDVLLLCPRMTVANAPAADAQGRIAGFKSVADVNGVALATNPTRGACLSSNFGARNGRTHKGVDLHSADGGPILAAADGVVIEHKYRDDYGNMLLIDHGKGVYTRYAHLSSFAPEIVAGAKVKAGQQIGLMGNTAAYRIPVHLHYEVLTGDIANPKGSFGLTPKAPLG